METDSILCQSMTKKSVNITGLGNQNPVRQKKQPFEAD